MRFNPPPGRPPAPPGWTPPVGWQPDPRWPRPPAGWNFWIADNSPSALDTISSVFGWIGRTIVSLVSLGFAVLCFIFGASDEATTGGTIIAFAVGVCALAYAIWITSGRAYFIIFFS
ncbi:hypothetical protein NS506_05049 [Nocardia seriolae]|uniref:Uncharacterized protein n=1 Tax=Nocardia seriolae TaxID=37332 RepID=A0ABC8AYE1_9NOCA|nr:hypothetical protein NS506_05049 [Nocardia seriolae]